jgi:hypothetical protein
MILLEQAAGPTCNRKKGAFMKTTQRKRLVWLVGFAALIALGAGFWFAHAQGLLDAA